MVKWLTLTKLLNNHYLLNLPSANDRLSNFPETSELMKCLSPHLSMDFQQKNHHNYSWQFWPYHYHLVRVKILIKHSYIIMCWSVLRHTKCLFLSTMIRQYKQRNKPYKIHTACHWDGSSFKWVNWEYFIFWLYRYIW